MYHPGNILLIITVWIWIIVLLRKTKTVNVFHMSPIHGVVSSCTGTQRNETLTNCVDMKTIGIPPCTGTPGQPPFMVCSYNVCWSLIWRYFKVLLLHIHCVPWHLSYLTSFLKNNVCGSSEWRAANNQPLKHAKLDETGLEMAEYWPGLA